MILGMREGKSCENKTWVMGCIILGSSCFEMLLVTIAMIVFCACRNDHSCGEFLSGLGCLYSFYSFIVFIIVQVFLFSKENDCKDCTV